MSLQFTKLVRAFFTVWNIRVIGRIYTYTARHINIGLYDVTY